MDDFLENLLKEYRSTFVSHQGHGRHQQGEEEESRPETEAGDSSGISGSQQAEVAISVDSKKSKYEKGEVFQEIPSEILYKITNQDCEQMLKLCKTNSGICPNKKLEELYQLYFNKTKKDVTFKEFSEMCLESKFLKPLTKKITLYLKNTGLLEPLGLIWEEVNEAEFTRFGAFQIYDDSLVSKNSEFGDEPTIGRIYRIKDDNIIPVVRSAVVCSNGRFFKPLGDILSLCKGVIAGGFLLYMHGCTGFGLQWKPIPKENIFTEDFAVPPYNLASEYDQKVKDGIATLEKKYGNDNFLKIVKETNVVRSSERFFKVEKSKEIGYSWKEIQEDDVFIDVTNNQEFSVNAETQEGLLTLREQFIPFKDVPHKKFNVYVIPNDLTPTIFDKFGALTTCIPPSKYFKHKKRHSVDIDLYVTKEQAQIFIIHLCKLHRIRNVKLLFIYSNIADNPQKIKYHFELLVLLYDLASPNPLDDNNVVKIDLVIVEKPEDVIYNFDFTFCQIGFCLKNGEYKCFATKDGVRDILRKTGRITGKFVKEFEDGNKITHNRMYKYMRRGYNMDLSNINSLRMLNYDKFIETRSNTPSELKRLREFVTPFFNRRFDLLSNKQKMLFFFNYYDEEKIEETRTAFGQYSNQYLNT